MTRVKIPSLRKRPRNSHKGTFGHLLLIGGSARKPGSVLLSGRAAMRSGVGLATVALPEKAFRKFTRAFREGLELMYEPLPSNARGTFAARAWRSLLKILTKKTAMALGPGLEVNADTKVFVKNILKATSLPLVLDADGLNAIAPVATVLRKFLKGRAVLTPHVGEMSRLLSLSVQRIEKDRRFAALTLARKTGAVAVLKGPGTVVASPEGKVFINPTGNPGMATAGMGDVLTGVIGALLAQGLKPFDAAVLGVFVHGAAGDAVARRFGEGGLIASDVIENLRDALRRKHGF